MESYTNIVVLLLHNRIQLWRGNINTFYKLLFIQIPSYSRLKVFNCLGFASTIAHNRFKFDPKAKQCVFLGYSFPVKGYKLLDLSTNTCFISRDDSIYVLPMSYEFLNSMKKKILKKKTKNAEIRNKY